MNANSKKEKKPEKKIRTNCVNSPKVSLRNRSNCCEMCSYNLLLQLFLIISSAKETTTTTTERAAVRGISHIPANFFHFFSTVRSYQIEWITDRWCILVSRRCCWICGPLSRRPLSWRTSRWPLGWRTSRWSFSRPLGRRTSRWPLGWRPLSRLACWISCGCRWWTWITAWWAPQPRMDANLMIEEANVRFSTTKYSLIQVYFEEGRDKE